jgi:thiamine-monophosphate kinase
MKETDLIKKYFFPLGKNFKPSIGLQDDGAVLKNFDKENFIISVDCFIEGVHCPNGLEPKLMIKRAIYCASSDLAAMASIPYCMFLSLTIPKNKEESFFKNISIGIRETINKIGISLAGGDLTSHDGPLVISVTVVGRKKSFTKPLLRKGSKVGDCIGITGFIGDAHIGLNILENKIKISDTKLKKNAINSFLLPPQLHKFACHLSKYAKACIDISDGLVDDIKKLSDLADCGISLSAERMPISDNAKYLLKIGTFTLEDYLTAGDDYQLAFTFNRKNIRYIKNLEKKFKLKISVIGELINKKGVFLNNKIIRGSFSHF